MSEPVHLLIVDDNPQDNMFIRRLLARDGERQYRFAEAALGEQVSAIMQATPIDCMLLDYQLPDFDGLELLRILPKGEDGLPTTPVIILTGQGDETVAVRALKAGAIDYLVKGLITVQRLSIAIQQAITTHALRGEIMRQRRALELSNAEVARARDTLEQQVAERTQELAQANRELVKAARMKDDFLSSLSHELRTPLNSIIGYNEMLQEGVYGPLTAQQHNRLQMVNESSYHLLALINDILDLAKILADKLTIEPSVVDVPALCERSLAIIEPTALEKQLTIARRIDPRVLLISGEAGRLKQILVNLLANAVKFTPIGGQIGLEVRAEPEQGYASFCIWDSGIGIAPEDQPYLFQPFMQVDGSLARAYEGSGLGLALAAELAKLHGGTIHLESSLGCGSRFTVRLPWTPVRIRTVA